MSAVSAAKGRKKIFYVYALYRERKQKPFYIGKGHGYRAEVHFRECSLRSNSPKNSIIEKDLAAGKRIRIKLLHEGLTEAQAFKLEREWIAYYGRVCDRTGCLVNLTDGGDGMSGHAPSASTRELMSAAQKVRYSDPAQRLAAGETSKERWQDQSYKTALKSKLKASWARPSSRERASAAAKERWNDPEQRRMKSVSSKKQWQDSERRKAFSELTKLRWQDPTYRQYMADCRAARKQERESQDI